MRSVRAAVFSLALVGCVENGLPGLERDASATSDAGTRRDAWAVADVGEAVDAGEPDRGADAGAPEHATDACAPAAETCDGRDEDCDGEIDDACTCAGDAQCGDGLRCRAGACSPVPRTLTITYEECEYERRGNWVLRCDGTFDYAYTARGSDHFALDCSDRYAPDGTRNGRAVFRFPAVAPGRYRVVVRGRHGTNRNPAGMPVRVGTEERRIDQTTGDTLMDDVWGEIDLEGDVTVVVDSREGQSESVAFVWLVPI